MSEEYFHEYVRCKMSEAHITATMIANGVGLSTAAISRYLSGKRTPSESTKSVIIRYIDEKVQESKTDKRFSMTLENAVKEKQAYDDSDDEFNEDVFNDDYNIEYQEQEYVISKTKEKFDALPSRAQNFMINNFNEFLYISEADFSIVCLIKKMEKTDRDSLLEILPERVKIDILDLHEYDFLKFRALDKLKRAKELEKKAGGVSNEEKNPDLWDKFEKKLRNERGTVAENFYERLEGYASFDLFDLEFLIRFNNAGIEPGNRLPNPAVFRPKGWQSPKQLWLINIARRLCTLSDSDCNAGCDSDARAYTMLKDVHGGQYWI